MLLIIDNYDSFTYNLVQYFGEMGAVMEIRRNDQVTLDEIRSMKPDHICISPGPCTPKEAGISCEVIQTFGESTPILGVCLGHQCIGHVFGGDVIRAGRWMHGKTSMIHHNGTSVFAGLPDPFEATRYHSLIVKRDTLPDCLEVTAEAGDDASEIMGLRHKELPIHGVQFHSESILTHQGKWLLKKTFWTGRWSEGRARPAFVSHASVVGFGKGDRKSKRRSERGAAEPAATFVGVWMSFRLLRVEGPFHAPAFHETSRSLTRTRPATD